MNKRTAATAAPSLAIMGTVIMLVWPVFLLLALNIHGVLGWLEKCLVWREPAGTAALLFLLLCTALVMGYSFRNIRRHRQLEHSLRHLPLLDDPKTARLRESLPALKEVTIKIRECDEPQAFTLGWRSPTIVLSRWLLNHLDEQEIIAALGHELAHIRHRDNLLMFWVHCLCPSGFGLSLFRRQFRHLMALVENRADTTGVTMTGDPLALASALIKVRKGMPTHPPQVASLTGDAGSLRWRIAVLLGESRRFPRFHWSATILLPALLLLTGLLTFSFDDLECAGAQCDLETMVLQLATETAGKQDPLSRSAIHRNFTALRH